MDTPDATTLDYATLWTIVAILNGGLYGVIGAGVIKLIRAVHGNKSE